MIWVSRLNGKQFILNCEMIKFIEETPDTMVTLSTGEKILVKEPAEKIIRDSVEYRKKLYDPTQWLKQRENG